MAVQIDRLGVIDRMS